MGVAVFTAALAILAITTIPHKEGKSRSKKNR